MRNLAGGSASAKAKAVYLCLPCSDCETLGHCCLITRVIQCTKHPTTFIDFSLSFWFSYIALLAVLIEFQLADTWLVGNLCLCHVLRPNRWPL